MELLPWRPRCRNNRFTNRTSSQAELESVKAAGRLRKKSAGTTHELQCERNKNSFAAVEGQIDLQNDQRPAWLFSLCSGAVGFGATFS